MSTYIILYRTNSSFLTNLHFLYTQNTNKLFNNIFGEVEVVKERLNIIFNINQQCLTRRLGICSVPVVNLFLKLKIAEIKTSSGGDDVIVSTENGPSSLYTQKKCALKASTIF